MVESIWNSSTSQLLSQTLFLIYTEQQPFHITEGDILNTNSDEDLKLIVSIVSKSSYRVSANAAAKVMNCFVLLIFPFRQS